MKTEDSNVEEKTPFMNRPHEAKVVLSQDLIDRILVNMLTGWPETEQGFTEPQAARASNIFAYRDPAYNYVLHVGADVPGGVTVKRETRDGTVGRKKHAAVFSQAQQILAAAINDDLPGFVLEALSAKWKKDLKLEDAEKIAHHVQELLKLLN